MQQHGARTARHDPGEILLRAPLLAGEVVGQRACAGLLSGRQRQRRRGATRGALLRRLVLAACALAERADQLAARLVVLVDQGAVAVRARLFDRGAQLLCGFGELLQCTGSGAADRCRAGVRRRLHLPGDVLELLFDRLLHGFEGGGQRCNFGARFVRIGFRARRRPQWQVDVDRLVDGGRHRFDVGRVILLLAGVQSADRRAGLVAGAADAGSLDVRIVLGGVLGADVPGEVGVGLRLGAVEGTERRPGGALDGRMGLCFALVDEAGRGVGGAIEFSARLAQIRAQIG